MIPCLAAALDYAKRGWLVIPLRGKIPITSHGSKDGTTNPEVIERWWEMWPDANVGICTGPESGLIVLDVDPRNGGTESLAELVKIHGCLPDTPTVVTGGGGYHFYFKWPHDLDSDECRKQIAPGVDIKGRGGYVVAPPSIHSESGNPYYWPPEDGE